MSGQARQGKPLRVIAWPAFRNHGDNPYNSLLYSRLTPLGVRVVDFLPHKLLFGRHDVWHIHWPDAILNLPWRWLVRPLVYTFRLLLRLARRRGTKVVWTVHNLRAHEGRFPDLEARLWADLLAHLDGFIALTEGGRLTALERHPALGDRPGFVIPHGDYRPAYPDTLTRPEARARLGLPPDARVLLWLGQIRPYKNLPHLIATFRRLPDPDLRLVIAGKPAIPELARQVADAAAGDARVRTHLDFVPAGEVQVYMRAADLVVLPYREVLNSGSAILALSFARPILVPDRGALAELQRGVGPEWVRTYPGDLDPAALRAALAWALHAPRDHGRLFRELSWETIARQTLAAYRTISAPPDVAHPASRPADPRLSRR